MMHFYKLAGHERYSGMSKVYYKYAHGALIVFDLARPETFESALGWLSDVTEKLFDEKPEAQCGVSANRPMPVVLLANKRDVPMVKIPRQVYIFSTEGSLDMTLKCVTQEQIFVVRSGKRSAGMV